MKIRLLSSALDDLSEGWLFYEKQVKGWESTSLILYFLILIL